MIRFPLGSVIVLLASVPVAFGQQPVPPLSRIAFGSCANQDKPLPIFDKVADQKPDLLVLLGDNIYADLDKSRTVTPAVIKEKYDTLAKLPGWQRLKATAPMLAVWDDHDYGENDGWAAWPLKDDAKRLMLDFFEVPADSPRRTRGGVYVSATYGPIGQRVQVILLDGRYFRSKLDKAEKPLPGTTILPYLPNTDANATMLGAEQWSWLAEQLKKPAELRLLCSGIQVVSEEHPFEKWTNFPLEREKLYKLIRETGANGVVVLSGDRHLGELSLDPGGAIGYPLYDLTSSGFNQGNKNWRAPETNKNRVAAMQYGDNFGVVAVDWARNDPLVSLQLRDVLGEVVVRQSFPLSLLQAKKATPAVTAAAPTPPAATPSATPAATAAMPEGVIGTVEAVKKFGEAVTVQFEVKGGRAIAGGQRILLNSEADFRSEKNLTVVVNAKAMTGKLDKATFATFQNRTVRVKGEVKKFRDQTQIEVDDEKQVEFVGK